MWAMRELAAASDEARERASPLSLVAQNAT
jgi:hypothetical protein